MWACKSEDGFKHVILVLKKKPNNEKVIFLSTRKSIFSQELIRKTVFLLLVVSENLRYTDLAFYVGDKRDN